MRKYGINMFIIVLILIFVIFTSYMLYSYGITDKVSANIEGYTHVVKDVNYSSGEEYTNSDVAIIVNIEGKYDLKKLEYSFDLKNWHIIKNNISKKSYTGKIVFDKTTNKTVYIRVIDTKGYQSYAHHTKVMIDKEKPSIVLNGNTLSVQDNTLVSYIQYSNDLKTWDEVLVSGSDVKINIENYDYKYFRCVDKVGNISKVIKMGK